MPVVAENTRDIEGSYSYISYERRQETAFLLSGHTSMTVSSISSHSTPIADGAHVVDAQEVPRSRYVLVMIACMYLHVSCFGMVVALGVIYVELISVFQCPHSQAALVQSLYMGLDLGGGLLFSKIITGYDTGVCVMVASVVAGLALAGASLARDIGTVIALVGVVAGLVMSVNFLSGFVVINWTFVKHRKLALSVLTLGAALGQIVMPFITVALVNEYYWNGSLLILSAITALNCIPCGLIIYYSKPYFHKRSTAKATANVSNSSFFTDSAFLVYMGTMFIFPSIGPVEQWFSVDLAILKGFGRQEGATLLTQNGIFGFVGRIVCVLVLNNYPKIRPEVHICYSFLLWAVSHFCVIKSVMYWEMFLAMVLRGFSSGIVLGLLPSLQIELRGIERYPQTISISNMLMGIGQIVGGYFSGYSVDITGSYNLIFYVATLAFVYCALSMCIIYVIFKRRKQISKQ